jgi:hypothetical protein
MDGQKFTFGYKIGLARVNQRYSIDFPGTIDPRFSYGFNAVVNYKITSKFNLEIEPGFIEKGSIIYLIPIDKSARKYGYLISPVLIRFYPIKNLSIDFGNEFGYLVYAKTKEYGLDGKVFSESLKNKNKFESSGIIGFSIICFGRVNLYYNMSIAYTPLMTAYYNQEYGPSGSYKIYNKYNAIGIRYFFNKTEED